MKGKIQSSVNKVIQLILKWTHSFPALRSLNTKRKENHLDKMTKIIQNNSRNLNPNYENLSLEIALA